jgi:predicted Rossmann fold flavoprotein
MDSPDVIVIGGGASGLMAAGQAAKAGARTVVLEKGGACAKKLSISGKGRSNLTNIAPLEDHIAAFGSTAEFLLPALSQFGPRETIEFLESIGVKTQIERAGRVFAVSEDARLVAQGLLAWAKRSGAQVRTGARVSSIVVEHGRVEAVRFGPHTLRAKGVVLATGGCSYPRTGSTGDGHALARSLGHEVVPPRPSLAPIECSAAPAVGWRSKNAELVLEWKQTIVSRETGEVVFTPDGLEGPAGLRLSAHLARHLRAVDPEPSYARHVPPGFTISLKARRAPRVRRMDVVRLGSFERAIVTCGGVSTAEIDPETMESDLVKGLYFCGEVIDIDAVTGGFNLQAAFSTGWLAGHSAQACVGAVAGPHV